MPFLVDALKTFILSSFRTRLFAKLIIVSGMVLMIFSVITIGSTIQVDQPTALIGKVVAQGATGGQAIFEEKCTGCHTIGGGKLIGPDLKDVAKRRDPQWLKNFITDPAKMIASDPTAQQLLKDNGNITMPTFGFSTEQVDQLVEFLSNPGALPSAPAAAPSASGDPALGQRLFTGEAALTNGGPPCLACHTVSGAGALGGGGLGPDLTHVVLRLGEPGLSAALKTISFPTMMGPFQNRPLTAKEQANLVAFFKDSDRWQDPVVETSPGALTSNAWKFFGIGLVFTGLLFGLLLFFWVGIKKRTSLRLPIRKV